MTENLNLTVNPTVIKSNSEQNKLPKNEYKIFNQFWRLVKNTLSLLCPLIIAGKIKIALSNFKNNYSSKKNSPKISSLNTIPNLNNPKIISTNSNSPSNYSSKETKIIQVKFQNSNQLLEPEIPILPNETNPENHKNFSNILTPFFNSELDSDLGFFAIFRKDLSFQNWKSEILEYSKSSQSPTITSIINLCQNLGAEFESLFYFQNSTKTTENLQVVINNLQPHIRIKDKEFYFWSPNNEKLIKKLDILQDLFCQVQKCHQEIKLKIEPKWQLEINYLTSFILQKTQKIVNYWDNCRENTLNCETPVLTGFLYPLVDFN